MSDATTAELLPEELADVLGFLIDCHEAGDVPPGTAIFASPDGCTVGLVVEHPSAGVCHFVQLELRAPWMAAVDLATAGRLLEKLNQADELAAGLADDLEASDGWRDKRWRQSVAEAARDLRAATLAAVNFFDPRAVLIPANVASATRWAYKMEGAGHGMH